MLDDYFFAYPCTAYRKNCAAIRLNEEAHNILRVASDELHIVILMLLEIDDPVYQVRTLALYYEGPSFQHRTYEVIVFDPTEDSSRYAAIALFNALLRQLHLTEVGEFQKIELLF